MKAEKIILGTVQFGLDYGINNTSGKPDPDTVFLILDKAYENNVRLLDTAEAYGDAQQIIGAYHRQSSNRFQVITKFGAKVPGLSQNIDERVMQDLQIMNIDSLYSYMFHSFNDFKLHFGNWKTSLAQLKQAGRFQKLGVSIYTNEEMEEVLTSDGVDLIQLPFNLLDNISKRGSLFEKAKKKGVEIHTRSVFLQGLFFRDPENLPGKLTGLKSSLQSVRRLANEAGLNINDLSLNYALQQNSIDRVLLGVESVAQLEANLKSLRKELNVSVLSELDKLNVSETRLLNPANWNS